MKPYELVKKAILGENDTGITPVYGWLFGGNLDEPLKREFGSVRAFEDRYSFDMAHIFGGPSTFDESMLEKMRAQGVELTPEVLLSLPMNDPDAEHSYDPVRAELEFYRGQRERFCYIQTNGIFEALNDVFGIENHLCYMLEYHDELMELYRRQAKWNRKFAANMLDLGVDMVHVSDDWGAQRSLLFSPKLWREMIYPNHKLVTDYVHSRGGLVSLHSDGNINAALDGIVDLGYDLIHPYQESAGMDYNVYLQNYADKFAILGGVCIQTTLGFGNYERLESEVRRVFALLKSRRWIACTTHMVQPHCSTEELCFCYDLICRLARGTGERG